MSNHSQSRPERSPQEDLWCHYASGEIDQTELLYPEVRFELVEGKFLIGGTLEGSRWLLKEALMGWGLEAGIAFAPLHQWWSALRIAYEVSHQTAEDWLIWAESFPISNPRRRWWPPLGSRYKAEDYGVKDRLRTSLRHAVTLGEVGYCFGPRYGLWIGNQVFTPDMLMLTTTSLAEDRFYDRYTRGAADLVIECMLPEWADLDEQVRKQYYEQHWVLHYWTVNPIAQQMQFWQWSPEGYQLQAVDADGCYRGLAGLTVTPELLWVKHNRYPGLPIVTSAWQPRSWHLIEEEGPESWDSIPFEPRLDLEPVPIQPEQFVSWCPEGKLESDPFPLIGRGTWGTRNAIGMLLMSVGMVETVKLIPAYEWVRVLRRIEREQQQDEQKRQHWWSQAQIVAQKLHQEAGIGGVGVIGDLLQPQPLHYWSELHLMLWDISEEIPDIDDIHSTEVPIELIEVMGASQADWQVMQRQVQVLVGEWRGQEEPGLGRQLKFQWLD